MNPAILDFLKDRSSPFVSVRSFLRGMVRTPRPGAFQPAWLVDTSLSLRMNKPYRSHEHLWSLAQPFGHLCFGPTHGILREADTPRKTGRLFQPPDGGLAQSDAPVQFGPAYVPHVNSFVSLFISNRAQTFELPRFHGREP